MYASVLRAAAVPWLPLSAGMSQTGAVRGGGTEFAIMTRSLFSSWAQLRKLSSAVIFVDIRKAFYSVLVEEVVGPVMGRMKSLESFAPDEIMYNSLFNDCPEKQNVDEGPATFQRDMSGAHCSLHLHAQHHGEAFGLARRLCQDLSVG